MNHADSIMRTCARIVMHGVKTARMKVYTRVRALSFAAVALLAINNAASRAEDERRPAGKKLKRKRERVRDG